MGQKVTGCNWKTFLILTAAHVVFLNLLPKSGYIIVVLISSQFLAANFCLFIECIGQNNKTRSRRGGYRQYTNVSTSKPSGITAATAASTRAMPSKEYHASVLSPPHTSTALATDSSTVNSSTVVSHLHQPYNKQQVLTKTLQSFEIRLRCLVLRSSPPSPGTRLWHQTRHKPNILPRHEALSPGISRFFSQLYGFSCCYRSSSSSPTPKAEPCRDERDR